MATVVNPSRPKVLYLFDADTSDRAESGLIAGLAEAGVDACVACTPGTPFDAAVRAAGLRTVPIRFRHKVDLRAIRDLRRLLAAGSFDLVHTFHKVTLTNGTLAAAGRRIPIVAYRGVIGNLSYWDPFAWLSFLNPRLERVICVCEAVRAYLLSKRLFGVFRLMDPSRLVTIHKGHRTEWYRTPSVPDLTTLGIPPGAFVVCVVARIKPRKGVRVLVEALDALGDRHDVHLLLVGPLQDPSLPAAIARSRAPARVHLAGFRRDAAALAGACHVIAAPSLRREGLPRAVIEAMAQGVPALVTNVGGSPELVRDGVEGRVVPPGDARALADAVAWLAEDPVRRAALGRQAQARIETAFNLDRTIEETRQLYTDLLRDRRAPRA